MKKLASFLQFVILLFALTFVVSRCNILAPVSDTNRPNTETKPGVKVDRELRFRQDIVDYAKKFTGKKYKYAGKDPKTGFDCSGFTYFVMKEYDIDIPGGSRAQENYGRKINVNQVQTGDLIFYRRSPNTDVFHVSLVVSNEADGIKVIHSTSRGVVIDNISSSSYWEPKISTARDVVSSKF